MYVSLDPGGTTGWATFDPGSTPRYRSGEVIYQQVWPYLQSVRSFTGKHPDVVIIETFRLREHPTKPDLVPVKVIGVVEEWARQNHVRIIYQQPDQAKFFWHNDRLKEIGIYAVAKPHANDAARHLLYALYMGELAATLSGRLDILHERIENIEPFSLDDRCPYCKMPAPIGAIHRCTASRTLG